MKRILSLATIMLCVLAVGVALSACGNGNSTTSPIVGSWEASHRQGQGSVEIYTFNANGTYTYVLNGTTVETGTWTLESGTGVTYTLRLIHNGQTTTHTVSFPTSGSLRFSGWRRGNSGCVFIKMS